MIVMTLFGWIVMAGLPVAAYPWAVVLLPSNATTGLRAASALALTAGAIALITFWAGLAGVALTFWTIALPLLTLIAVGIALWLRAGGRPALPRFDWPVSLAGRAALVIALITGSAALFNALYLPFKTDDALGIYQPQAQTIFQTGALIPLTGADSLYRAYPMLVPFNYAFAYAASGWENEYAAKLIPTLLALSGLIAVYELARLLASARAGWLTVGLLALTPAFARWASSGYVDLPMAAYYALAALFCLRAVRGDRRAALLSAVWIGLAAWTKNAALIGVGLWAAALGVAWLTRRIPLRTLVTAGAIAIIIAAPWYVRNLIGAGFLIPDTAWTEQAERTLDTALVYITLPDNFGLTGAVILVAVAWAVLRLVRGGQNERIDLVIVLGFTLPFFAAWWLFVSYDPRFVLLFTPILCALAGWFLDASIPTLPRTFSRALALAGVIAALYIAFISVDYKDETLRDPFMSHEAKLVLVGREG